MFIEKDEFIIRCGCRDVSHPIWFSIGRGFFDAGSSPDEMFISLQVPDLKFWYRIKDCLRYLWFGHRKFWCYGDVVLNLENKEEMNEVIGLYEYLGKVIAETVKNEENKP
jgi:hypothetical protein